MATTLADLLGNGRDCGVDGSRAQWRTETWRNSAHRFVGNTQVTPPEVGLRVPDFGANESAMAARAAIEVQFDR
jgi:hypothetical protein